MIDEEIIKGLECCSIIKGGCKNCLLHNRDGSCTTILVKNALDLINHQRAEIERLKKIGTEADNFARAICNERMLKGKPVADYEDLQEYIKKAKAEAINEFAERLKTASYYEFEELIPSIMADKIDNLVKEMVGEEQCTNQK